MVAMPKYSGMAEIAKLAAFSSALISMSPYWRWHRLLTLKRVAL